MEKERGFDLNVKISIVCLSSSDVMEKERGFDLTVKKSIVCLSSSGEMKSPLQDSMSVSQIDSCADTDVPGWP